MFFILQNTDPIYDCFLSVPSASPTPFLLHFLSRFPSFKCPPPLRLSLAHPSEKCAEAHPTSHHSIVSGRRSPTPGSRAQWHPGDQSEDGAYPDSSKNLDPGVSPTTSRPRSEEILLDLTEHRGLCQDLRPHPTPPQINISALCLLAPPALITVISHCPKGARSAILDF